MKKIEEESNSINKKEQFKLAKLSEFMEFGLTWHELGKLEKKELRYKREMEKLVTLKETNYPEYEEAIKKRNENIRIKNLTIAKRRREKLKDKEKLLNRGTYKYLEKKEKVLLAKELSVDNLLLKSITTNYNKNIEKIQLYITVDSYKKAIEILPKINLIELFNLKVKLGENFTCILYKDNIASINRNEDGNYNYFSRSLDNKQKYVIDIIDLFEIIYNIGYYDTIREVSSLLKITISEDEWGDGQMLKYARNIRVIENADSEMSIRYPVLYKYISKHLYVIEKMNCIGIKNVNTKEYSVNDESIFFASSRYIEEELKKYDITNKSHATINRLLNMFCSIGLLEKVQLKNIPENLLKNTNDYLFSVSFFRIPLMTTEVLTEAQKRVLKLKKAKVTATEVNMDNVEKALGKRIYNTVYKDTEIKTYNIVQRKKWYKEQEQYEISREFETENNDIF